LIIAKTHKSEQQNSFNLISPKESKANDHKAMPKTSSHKAMPKASGHKAMPKASGHKAEGGPKVSVSERSI